MKKLLRDNGLTIVLMVCFLISLIGMIVAGLGSYNSELAEHSAQGVGLAAYLRSGQFVSALFENWESEFLQMAAYVVFTAMLFQRGSAESRDPDDPERPDDKLPPWPSRTARWFYGRSLGLALAGLFVLSFLAHWHGSLAAANEDARLHGTPAHSALAYLGEAEFWFESFQNWQSEFLSTAVLVVLSIWLRHRGSPESKPVASSDSETGA
ncbi:MAG TPA: DUF6766 family protein [Mesorhizobium sp.]|jgi:membrane protein implicated in regulation of membrane protease activity|uniref:DUF6766 family protein n=1 Tax=Mesorhizobium sp. TaxID=1871066 RepID=UPI002DDD3D4C|nr:DUF6766 family protein [Mesorhizobium sp.]HEV2503638.1 DUF6766 family protein [Mesorhizobium sp.]